MTAISVRDRYFSHHHLLLGIAGIILITSFAPVAVQSVKSAVQPQPGVKSTEADFQTALKQTLKWEGGGCGNERNDAGGLTCKGITDAEYRKWRQAHGKPEQAVTGMTQDEAIAIYKGYWERCNAGDKPMPLSFAVLDTCVNFNEAKVRDWFENLPNDPKQAAATIFDRRMVYRKQRVQEKPDQQKFLAGWLNRDEDGKKFALNYSSSARATVSISPPSSDPSASVVSLYAGTQQGSGVSFGNRRIVTNAHVVKEAGERVAVKLPNGESASALIKAQNNNLDLALLELDRDIPAIALATIAPRPGDRVSSIGNRFGKPGTKTEGKVLSAEPNRPARADSNLLHPGNSGGAVVNDRGELIGMGWRTSPKNSLAIPTSVVQEFLK